MVKFRKPKILMIAGLILISMVINLIFVVELIQRGELWFDYSISDGNKIVNNDTQITDNSQTKDNGPNVNLTQGIDNISSNVEISNEYDFPFAFIAIYLIVALVALGISSYYSPLTYLVINLIKKVAYRG